MKDREVSSREPADNCADAPEQEGTALAVERSISGASTDSGSDPASDGGSCSGVRAVAMFKTHLANALPGVLYFRWKKRVRAVPHNFASQRVVGRALENAYGVDESVPGRHRNLCPQWKSFHRLPVSGLSQGATRQQEQRSQRKGYSQLSHDHMLDSRLREEWPA